MTRKTVHSHSALFTALLISAMLSACATSDPVGNQGDVQEDTQASSDTSNTWGTDTGTDGTSDFLPGKLDIDLGGGDGGSQEDLTDQDTASDTSSEPGGLCDDCQTNADCGGQNDLCLRNNNTGQNLCGRGCSGPADCPADYVCAPIPNAIPQCVPANDTCGSNTPPPATCDPTCGAGEQCVDGTCVVGGEYEAELQYCVDLVNQYRSEHGRSQLTRSSALEDCASAGAQSDAQTGQPHGHFSSTGGCGGTAFAENEIPGWNLQQYGSVEVVIREGIRMMMNEGPGGGHYENILRSSHTSVGCGIHVTQGGEVWVVQNFR